MKFIVLLSVVIASAIMLIAVSLLLQQTTFEASDIVIGNLSMLSEHAVPIELFVMSKCPDAVFCENVFSDVLSKTHIPTSLTLHYIASHNSSEPLKATCKHGRSECTGNVQQLCFRHVYPERESWFPFVLCLNRDYERIGERKYARECAEESGYDYSLVDRCVMDGTGAELLARSIETTRAREVRWSCTIFIDNKLRCIHDGVWKECEEGHEVADFIRTIERAYKKKTRLIS